MATRIAATSGLWSNTSTWGGTLPAYNDYCYANGYTVTVDVDLKYHSSSMDYRIARLYNRSGTGIAGGGTFLITSTRQIGDTGTYARACRVYGQMSATSTSYCITFNPSNQTDVFTLYSDTVWSGSSGGHGILIANRGTANIYAELRASGSAENGCALVIDSAASGFQLNITGSVYGGASSSHGIVCNAPGSITINGSVYGGTIGHGIYNTGGADITIIGDVIGGGEETSYGIYCTNGGSITITGTVRSDFGPAIYYENGTGQIRITGNVEGRNAPAIHSTSNAYLSIEGDCTANPAPAVHWTGSSSYFLLKGDQYDAYTGTDAGTTAVVAYKRALPTNYADRKIRVAVAGSYPGIYAGRPGWLYGANIGATGYPSPSDVRYGISYGNSSQYTGTCHIPSADAVSYGVPVDNTVGTEYIDGNDISAGYGSVVSHTQNTSTSFRTTLSGSALKYVGTYIRFVSGNLSGQIREIVHFDPVSSFVTVNKGFSGIPQAGSSFMLIGYSGR